MELTDDEAIRRVHGFGRGVSDAWDYLAAERAIEVAPTDLRVLANCLSIWAEFAKPIDSEWSEKGPSRERGRVLVARALVAAERRLAAGPIDTDDGRLAEVWVEHLRALGLIIERPDDAQLAEADRRVNRGYDLIDKLGDASDRFDSWFRWQVLARLRSWQLLRAGPPYEIDARDRLGHYLHACSYGYGWPVAPLSGDATLRAFATAQLAERTTHGTHPCPPEGQVDGLFIDGLTSRDSPSPEEVEGRVLLLLWLGGIDAERFLLWSEQVLACPSRWAPKGTPRQPGVLATLLSLGFDPDRHTTGGETLLGLAVAADDAVAVGLLVAAGAKPDRKARTGKKQSARQLATARKRARVIAALEGGGGTTATAPSTQAAALATTLRAAARRAPSRLVRWMASNFGVTTLDLVALVERALARSPEDAAAILEDLAGDSVVDRYVMAHLLREAGLGADVRRKGTLALDADLTVAGHLIVDGVILDGQGGGSLVVAGDLDATAVVTEADMAIGGELRARAYVWGDYNDGSLAVGSIATPLVVMTDHTFETFGKATIARSLEDPEAHELAELFVPAVIVDGALDRERAVTRIRAGKPIVVTSKAAAKKPPAKKPPAKQPPAKKPPAKKPPAKKPAKQPPAKKPPARKPAPGKAKPGRR